MVKGKNLDFLMWKFPIICLEVFAFLFLDFRNSVNFHLPVPLSKRQNLEIRFFYPQIILFQKLA